MSPFEKVFFNNYFNHILEKIFDNLGDCSNDVINLACINKQMVQVIKNDVSLKKGIVYAIKLKKFELLLEKLENSKFKKHTSIDSEMNEVNRLTFEDVFFIKSMNHILEKILYYLNDNLDDLINLVCINKKMVQLVKNDKNLHYIIMCTIKKKRIKSQDFEWTDTRRLEVACELGCLSKVNQYCVNVTNKFNNAIHLAVKNGNLEVMKILVEKRNANIQLEGLHEAVKYNSCDILKYLISQGAEINMLNYEGISPLCIASHNGNIESVKILLDNGADVETKDSFKRTPLHLSAQRGYWSIVKLLIEIGNADIHAMAKNDETILHCVAAKNNIPMMEYLLRKGANIDEEDKQGKTALWIASSKGFDNTVDFLLENRAKVDVKGGPFKTTPLHVAALNGHFLVVRTLVENGNADINAINYKGKTVLFYGAISNNIEILEYLMRQGAKIDAVDNDGRTALWDASYFSYTEAVEFLLNNGADVEIKGQDGKTTLHFAAEEGHLSVVKILIEIGNANVNVQNNLGQTPLQLAKIRNHSHVIDYLQGVSSIWGFLKNTLYKFLP